MLDVEGPQGPGDTSTPNPVDEPMHDAHAEVGLGQRPDSQPLQEQVLLQSSAAAVKRWASARGGGIHVVKARPRRGNALTPLSLGRSTQTPWVFVFLPWSCPLARRNSRTHAAPPPARHSRPPPHAPTHPFVPPPACDEVFITAARLFKFC